MPAGTPRSTDSGFDLTRDAFTFENFAVGYDASRMTPELAARMFGADKVCNGATSTADYCETSLGAQGWIDSVNASLENGRCEGLAVMSQLLFLGDLKAQDFGAATARDLTLARNFDLQRELAYWFSTQLVPGAVKNERLMPRDVLPFLAKFLKADATESYRIGMVQKLATGFGLSHSLTPIGYYAGPTDGVYFIRVYDNNFPGAERAIKLDVNANTWAYDGVSSQGPVSFTGGAANKNPLYFAPIRARKGALPCPFCEDTPAKTVLASGAIQVAAKDMAGNTNGVVGGEVVESNGGSVSPGFGLCIDNQCSDGSPLTVINAPSKKGETLKLAIQPGDPTMMQAGTNTVRVGGDSGTVTISGIKPKAGSNDEVTIANGGKTVEYKSDSDQPVKVTASFVFKDGSLNGSRIEVSVDVKGGADSVQLEFDPVTGKVSAKTTGAEGTPITVSVVRSPGLAAGRAEFNVTGSADGTVSFGGHDINPNGVPKATVQNGSAAAVTIDSNSCVSYGKDGDETDINCGGPICGKCAVDKLCKVDGDCQSGVCRSTTWFDRPTNKWETVNRCRTSCENQKKDDGETDIDCGGVCSRDCEPGQACKLDTDCSGICRRDTLVCTSPWSVKLTTSGYGGTNGFDVRLKPDGSHDAYEDGLTKPQQRTMYVGSTEYFYMTRVVGPWSLEVTRQPRGALCAPDVASGDVTGKPVGLITVNITCTQVELPCENGKKDGQESDVDCGGADCRAEARFCARNKACVSDADCGAPSVKMFCGAAKTCVKAYDVVGDVVGLAAGEQVTVRHKGTLTDPAAYREAVVVGQAGAAGVNFSLLNTRSTGVPVTLETANPPAGKTCAALGTGSMGSLAVSIRVRCETATPVDLCADGKKGENETDIDCGGAECRAKNLFCGDGKGCAADTDCNTGTTKRICSSTKACLGTFEIGGRVDGDYDQLELGLTPGGTLAAASATARTLTIPVKANPSLPSSFKFDDTRVTTADTYAVTISKAPTTATCTLMNATGKATAHVTNVVVTCVPKSTSSGRSWAKLATTGLGGAAEGHNGVFNAATDDVFALGAGTVRRFDGATWSDLGAGLEGLALYGLAGTGPDSIWVTCESNILKYWNGAQWFSPVPGLASTTNIYGIAVNSTIKQAYVVGTGGAIAQGDDMGGDFADEFGGGGGPGGPGFPGGGFPGSPPPTSSDLYGVWVADSGRVFAAGDAGALVYKAGPGGLWQASIAKPTTKNLRGVWASGDSDAWAVGAGGTIVHFDGSDWTAATSGVTEDLYAVWGASKDMVWAAGANGRVLFYDGKAWLKETTPSTATLRSISGRPGDDKPYVIGDNDTFMRRQ